MPALILRSRGGDHLDTGSRAGHHVEGARRIVEGQRVRLLHGSISHLLDGDSGRQIVTNDGVGRRLCHPRQPVALPDAARPYGRSRTGKRWRRISGSTPYTSSSPPRVSATSTRPAGSAAIVVAPSPARSACSDVGAVGVQAGDRGLPAVQHDRRIALRDNGVHPREDLQPRADRGVGGQCVHGTVGAAQHQPAVGAPGDGGEIDRVLALARRPSSRCAAAMSNRK